CPTRSAIRSSGCAATHGGGFPSSTRGRKSPSSRRRSSTNCWTGWHRMTKARARARTTKPTLRRIETQRHEQRNEGTQKNDECRIGHNKHENAQKEATNEIAEHLIVGSSSSCLFVFFVAILLFCVSLWLNSSQKRVRR